jgi:hypothetical protein
MSAIEGKNGHRQSVSQRLLMTRRGHGASLAGTPFLRVKRSTQWTGPPLPDVHAHLSGMTISRSLVPTTKMARSLAGSVLLALWLTW